MGQAAMKQMAEQMSTLCKSTATTENVNAAKEVQEDKENVPPGFEKIKKKDKRRGGLGNETKREPKLCPNCKRKVFHAPERCMELESNKQWRPKHWKSVL